MTWLRSPMSVEPARWPSSTKSLGAPEGRPRSRGSNAPSSVAVEREIAGEGLDLHGGAQREGARPQRAVHLGVGVEDGGQGAPAHVGLDARLRRDHVHLRAARGEDRMHADGVLVPERLAEGVDGHEPDLGGVERVDAQVGRAAGMRGLADIARELAHAPVVRQRHAGLAVLRARGEVNHHREVHVVEVAEAEQLGLAAQELERPAVTWLTRHSRSPPSSAGTAKNVARPARCSKAFASRRPMAAPSMPATCALWPQACAAPVSGSASGWPGTRSPSSSPSTAKVGPAPAPPGTSARTPVNASPDRGESPSVLNVSSTSRAVLTSLKPSSGCFRIVSPMR